MSSYDDWVVNFKVNTKPIDDAIRKVQQLRTEMNSLYGSRGNPLGGGTGRGGGRPSSDPRTEANRQFAESMRALQHNQRLRERYERAQQREFNERIRGLRNSQRMEQRYQREQRRTQQAQERSRVGAETLNRNEQLRRRDIQQRRDMEMYNRNAARRREAEIQGNRDTRLSSAKESRNYTLDRLEERARQAGVSVDQDRLSALRSSLAGARNFTQLDQIKTQMRQFADVTNAAIARQNALNRQMQQSGFAATAFTNSMKNLAASMLGVYAIGNTMTNMYNRAKELQSNQSKLIMGTGSQAGATNAFAKIKATAKETGLGVNQITSLYGKLAINASQSGMSETETDAIFKSITTMMVGYGLNENEQKYVTKAFSQMLSKQQVMAEEFDFRLAA